MHPINCRTVSCVGPHLCLNVWRWDSDCKSYVNILKGTAQPQFQSERRQSQFKKIQKLAYFGKLQWEWQSHTRIRFGMKRLPTPQRIFLTLFPFCYLNRLFSFSFQMLCTEACCDTKPVSIQYLLFFTQPFILEGRSAISVALKYETVYDRIKTCVIICLTGFVL
jgi:hypothetical protein